jgi:hypothetical protein
MNHFSSRSAVFTVNIVLVMAVIPQSSVLIMASNESHVTDDHGTDSQPEHFKIGFLAPWNASFDDFSALTSASAVSIALERIHADPSFRNRFRFRFAYLFVNKKRVLSIESII